jgi:pyruvate,water dikinase
MPSPHPVQLTRTLDTNAPPDLSQVGGKALSLILMTREGRPVPPGFVLTVDFFQPWLSKVRISPEWSQFLQTPAEQLKPGCDAIKAFCDGLTWTSEQTEELQKAVEYLNLPTPELVLAVRSSSPEEDLEGTSFAGGYETTLGVTMDTLEAAVLRSFASLFDERVVTYKLRNGLPIDQPRIAVIVQRQIASEVSGVAFSLNPQNNCYDEAVINASFGLGETVVSGQVTPDTFIVDKVLHTIIQKRPGRKDYALWLEQGGGTAQRAVADPGRLCLNDRQVLEVTDLVTGVEQRFGKPMDIEWAYAGGHLYLLQARPVTAYLSLPPEMLTQPGQPRRLYSDALLTKQGFQEPLSVLGSDHFDRLGCIAIKAQFGRDLRGIEDGLLFSAAGRMYMQVSNLARVVGRKRMAFVAGAGDFAAMETLKQIDFEEYLPRRTPRKLRGMVLSVATMGIKTGISGVIGYLRPEATLRMYQKGMRDFQQKFQELSELDGTFRELFETSFGRMMDMLGNSKMVGILLPPIIARFEMKRLFKHEDVADLMVHLEMALPGNPTSEMGRKMYGLASFSEVKDCSDGKSFAIQLADRSLSPEFLNAWDEYMQQFGFRCIREIDPATPRPYERPVEFFQQLKAMSLAEAGAENIFASAERKQNQAHAQLQRLAARKGKQKAFDRYAGILRSMAGYREVPKYYLVMTTDLIRRWALALADRWVDQGRLEHRDQIFHLTVEDIERAESDPQFDLGPVIEDNTAYWKTVKDRKDWPRILDSRGKFFRMAPDTTVPGSLIGEPIAPGVVRGRAKVLNDPYEKPLQRGEILVTRATDPGWTPLFMNAAGVILEVGGALQHGAVIAREYGIPCVSGVEGAATTLKDGQMVEVDGSAGVIRVLDLEDDNR